MTRVLRATWRFLRDRMDDFWEGYRTTFGTRR